MPDNANVNRTRRRVASAAALVGVFYMISRVLGLVRQIIFNAYFGTTTDPAVAYFIVAPITDLIFNIIAGGALGSAFIPVFSGYFADEENRDEQGGWSLFSTIVTLVLMVATGIALFTALFAPQILVRYSARLVDNAELLRQTVLLLRIWLIATVIFGASGVLMVALNARQHFLRPALATVVYNIGIILGIVLFPDSVIGVGIGAAVGALGHLLIQLPALREVGGWYRPMIRLNAAVREIGWLMLPRVVGLSFSSANLLIMPMLAGKMADGSEAALGTAARIMLLPQSILGQAIGVASFPTFATLAAKQDYPAMRQILADTLRFILFLGFPIAAGMMLLRDPLIAFAFERGNFDQSDTALVAFALLFYALALVALSMIEVLVRAFYAMKDTWTPVIAGALQMASFFGLAWWLGRVVFPANDWLGLGGIALAYTITNWVEVTILLILLRRKMGGIGATDLVDGAWRMIAATIGMGGGVWIVHFMIKRVTIGNVDGIIAFLIQLGVSTFAGMVLYLTLCYILRVRELRQVTKLLRRR